MLPKISFNDRLVTYDMDDGDPNIDWNDKGNVTDIFAIDLTLEELKTLRRKQVTYTIRAKILLRFFYLIGTRKLEVIGTITWSAPETCG